MSATLKNIPQIGFGTWNLDGPTTYDCVRTALDVGYRHIDAAEGYGNEEFVGKAIADSGVPRNDIFLTTKVAPESFAPGQIRLHVEASLEKLRVDQVDLLLLHYPSINDEYDITDYMAQFAAVYDAGLTRAIGVSNFTKRYIDKAQELLAPRQIATNQVELHPFMQNQPIVQHCQDRNIPMTAFSPLARGGVANDTTLREIGAVHNATPAQVALAFLMQEGFVVIPSSSNPERIAENFAATEVQLSERDVTKIRSLECGRRLVNGPWCPKWDV